MKYEKVPTQPGGNYGATNVDANQSEAASASSSSSSTFCGMEALGRLTQDGRLLMATRALRLFAFGFLAVILALYLQSMGYTESQVGGLFTLTLLGDAAIALYMTSRADVMGRRRMLRVGALLKVITGIAFCLTTNFWILLICGIFGVISPSGKEVGPFLAIEQAALTQTIRPNDRTRLFAWYNLFGDFCSAFGALICGGLITYLTEGPLQLADFDAYRIVMVLYSIIGLSLFFLFLGLSPAVEAQVHALKATPVAQFLGLHQSKWLVIQLSLLFMIDSFAGGFILQSMVSAWFADTYQTKAAVLGTIVFICNLVSAVSALFAVQLADLVGLIMTMVITHLPSNILLILVPLMPTEIWAIVIYCLRFCISQMDVPTRNSFVMAVVREDERSAAGGVTNICRSIGASTGPYLSGLLFQEPGYQSYPFFIAGGLKIIYDLLLLGSFAAVKTPEEQEKHDQKQLKEAAAHANAPDPRKSTPLRGTIAV